MIPLTSILAPSAPSSSAAHYSYQRRLSTVDSYSEKPRRLSHFRAAPSPRDSAALAYRHNYNDFEKRYTDHTRTEPSLQHHLIGHKDDSYTPAGTSTLPPLFTHFDAYRHNRRSQSRGQGDLLIGRRSQKSLESKEEPLLENIKAIKHSAQGHTAALSPPVPQQPPSAPILPPLSDLERLPLFHQRTLPTPHTQPHTPISSYSDIRGRLSQHSPHMASDYFPEEPTPDQGSAVSGTGPSNATPQSAKVKGKLPGYLVEDYEKPHGTPRSELEQTPQPKKTRKRKSGGTTKEPAKRLRPHYPAYNDEQADMIRFLRDDLSQDWHTVVRLYNQYWHPYEDDPKKGRNMSGLQSRYYRSLQLPVRERKKVSGVVGRPDMGILEVTDRRYWWMIGMFSPEEQDENQKRQEDEERLMTEELESETEPLEVQKPRARNNFTEEEAEATDATDMTDDEDELESTANSETPDNRRRLPMPSYESDRTYLKALNFHTDSTAPNSPAEEITTALPTDSQSSATNLDLRSSPQEPPKVVYRGARVFEPGDGRVRVFRKARKRSHNDAEMNWSDVGSIRRGC